MTRACYAVDVGGTKIAAALVDETGRELAACRRPTNAAQGGAAVLEAMAACIDELSATLAAGYTGHGYTVAGIGISAAGVIDPVRAAVADATDAMPGWKGTELGAWFSQRYGMPVYAANDVHCALLGELWLNPALAGRQGTVAMLALGTGLGGAIAVQGRIQAGKHFLAGHFGRALVYDASSGKAVPVESLVSGTGLQNLYRRGHSAQAGQDGAAIMRLAASGDVAASSALSTWLDHLALQLHNIYWTCDPEVLLLGGGVTDTRQLWWDTLLERVAALGASLDIQPAALGNRAGIAGAAKLVWNADEKL
ncbi:ROK family protein [Pseudoduganella aquatica]|uniref:ROK family protein n=1 Tax=Pseudoduganella aquatica TaxID=2660641 RepID=A0A7X4KL34_9BURK|nr:ROK family protein [Pseudoduganella aquatica]MYN06747.1 ROK family protein [Pseudoduganella aquatica]